MKKLAFLLAFLAFGLITGCSSPEHELHLYVWADYIKPALIERFEQEHECQVIVDTYDSNESMYAKLKAGATGYDLIFPSSYIVEIMAEQGMLQPIDERKVPNLKYLDPSFLTYASPSIQNLGYPYLISYSGVAYRQDKVKEIKHSWDVFGSNNYKGRMTMLNDSRETLGAALRYLGFSINTTNSDEINKAAQQIIQWKKNLAKFESEQYKNGIASGEYLVAHGYNGDILQVMQENPHVQFFLPEEGSVISIDYMVIPKNAGNTKLAQEFMDYLLEPEVAAENMAYTFFLCPNLGAYEHLPDEMKNNPALFPPKEIMDKSEVIKNLGKETEIYNKAWDAVKST